VNYVDFKMHGATIKIQSIQYGNVSTDRLGTSGRSLWIREGHFGNHLSLWCVSDQLIRTGEHAEIRIMYYIPSVLTVYNTLYR